MSSSSAARSGFETFFSSLSLAYFLISLSLSLSLSLSPPLERPRKPTKKKDARTSFFFFFTFFFFLLARARMTRREEKEEDFSKEKEWGGKFLRGLLLERRRGFSLVRISSFKYVFCIELFSC